MAEAMYKITEINQAKKDFRCVFNTGLNQFLEDKLIIALSQQIVINIISFDHHLQKEHPEIIESGLALDEVVKKYYGDDGLKLLDKLSLK